MRPVRIGPCPGSGRWVLVSVAGLALLPAAAVRAQPPDKSAAVEWQDGPSTARLGSIAEIRVPEGYRFADARDTVRLMELMENPTDGSELGLVAPLDDDWFIVFEFDEVGYVRDSDRGELDPDALLANIRKSNEQGNRERSKRGWSTLEIVGWEQPPRYDAHTNNLVWAVRARSEGHAVVNYNTRRLGRKGVMRVTLVTDPEQLGPVVPRFDELMTGFAFAAGSGYGDFEIGDKVAEYGLTALITGGAAAVAVKSGLFKWLWKGLVVAVLAIGGAIKALFRRRQPAS